jgi:hypothetical protein
MWEQKGKKSESRRGLPGVQYASTNNDGSMYVT